MPDTLAQVFSCEICEIFMNTFFHKTPLAAASGQCTIIVSNITTSPMCVVLVSVKNYKQELGFRFSFKS